MLKIKQYISNFLYKAFKYFNLILGLGILLCLPACEVNSGDEEFPPAGNVIDFFAKFNNPQTKAADGHPIVGTEFPNGQSLGIYAYQIGFTGSGSVEPFKNPLTSQIAFNNMRATKGENGISYFPQVHWPLFETDQSLRFFAYYPHNQEYDNINIVQKDDAEQIDMTYTLSGDPSKHIDLMYWMGPLLDTDADPVSIAFNHALTRIRFQAALSTINSFPDGTSVQVTQIEIKNTVTEGTLQVTSNGSTIDATWNLNDGVKNSLLLTTTNGLQNGVTLSTSPAYILEDGGDILAIPQDASGLIVEMTTSINGISKVYTYDLGKTSVLQWGMNKSITYLFEFGTDGISVSSQVLDWTDVGQNVIMNGQYYLKTSLVKVYVGSGGGNVPVSFETNYDGLTGYDAGLQLDDSQTVTDGRWCTISMGENTGTDKIVRQLATLTVEEYTPEEENSRSTSFIVSAGNLNYKIIVEQAASEWLNITLSSPLGFPLGGEKHSFTLTSITSNEWMIKEVYDPDAILLPAFQWVGATGTNTVCYFFFKEKVIAGQTAIITVGDTSGTLPNKTFAITAIEE